MKNIKKIISLIFCFIVFELISMERESSFYADIPLYQIEPTYQIELEKKEKSESSPLSSRSGYYDVAPSSSPKNRTSILYSAADILKEANGTKDLKAAWPKYEDALNNLKQNVEKNEKLVLTIYRDLLSRLAYSNILAENPQLVNSTIAEAKDYLISSVNITKNDSELLKLEKAIIAYAELIRAIQLLTVKSNIDIADRAKQAIRILSFIKAGDQNLQALINKRIILAYSLVFDYEDSPEEKVHFARMAHESLTNMGSNIDKTNDKYKKIIRYINELIK